eukprot:2734046-Prymnesium_polylepis.1
MLPECTPGDTNTWTRTDKGWSEYCHSVCLPRPRSPLTHTRASPTRAPSACHVPSTRNTQVARGPGAGGHASGTRNRQTRRGHARS